MTVIAIVFLVGFAILGMAGVFLVILYWRSYAGGRVERGFDVIQKDDERRI